MPVALLNVCPCALLRAYMQGFYLGDTFYPCESRPEPHVHELYLRLANKPMAPLKLHANVIGNFKFGQAVDSLHERYRNKTLEAERQRTERKTIMLDAPPPEVSKPPKGKTKKDTAAARRAAASSTPSHASTSARPPPPTTSLIPSSSSAGDKSSTRARLIHCLALKPRTGEQVLRLCGGNELSTQTKQELRTLIRSVSTQRAMS